MTNKFFDYVQPSIIKTSNHPELPENLRNKYFLNFNILGIRYFEQYYLLKESENGSPYLLIKEDNYGIELEESLDDYFDKILDIPRIYIDITKEFINDTDVFRNFVFQSIKQNSIYAVGINGFLAGKDYWLNTTLYNYLANTNQIEIPNFSSRMPNYLNDLGQITEYFEDISNSPFKDYSNLEYYQKKNQLIDNKYSEKELMDFYKTFCSIILEQSFISDDLKNSGNNAIYNIVLNYFKNNQSDYASTALNIVMNNLYSTTETSKSCSCNSSLNATLNSITNNTSNIETKSCSSLYENAMIEYLKSMLGDIQFYKDWFNIDLSEWESEVNDVLCDDLLEFLNEFIELDFCLDFDNLTTKVHNCLNCNHTLLNSNESKNKSIIENYIKVLHFIKDKQITPNTNRIKIWGSAFGELLPSLQFN